MQKLVLIGAGPKWAALAAKCAVLHVAGQVAPSIEIFEKDNIGAAWTGEFSFTDGVSKICTSIDRDRGFPYSDVRSEPEPILSSVNTLLLGGFSWRTFLSEAGIEKEGDEELSTESMVDLKGTSKDQEVDEVGHEVDQDIVVPDLNEWMSKGCPQPTHTLFATYLRWAIEKAVSISNGKVLYREGSRITKIAHAGGRWLIESDGSEPVKCDGVVVTGWGPPTKSLVEVPDKAPLPDLLFNGLDFWRKETLERLRSEVERLLATPTGRPSIAIAGQGGTAASVVYYLCREFDLGQEVDLHIYGPSPFFDSRLANYFSDKFYSLPEEWRERSPAFRNEFIKRTNRGRVWQQVVAELQDYELDYVCGRVRKVTFEDSAGVGQFHLHVDVTQLERNGAVGEIKGEDAEVLIDCSGFDSVWFLDVISDELKAHLLLDNVRNDSDVKRLSKGLDHAFRLIADGVPMGLHVPNFGGLVHAAATNLMALGSVADAILEPYR